MKRYRYADSYADEVRAWADIEAITGRGSARHTLDGRSVSPATDHLDLLADRAASLGARLAREVALFLPSPLVSSRHNGCSP